MMTGQRNCIVRISSKALDEALEGFTPPVTLGTPTVVTQDNVPADPPPSNPEE